MSAPTPSFPGGQDSDVFELAKWIGGGVVGIAAAIYKLFGGGDRKRAREERKAILDALGTFREDLRTIRGDIGGIRSDMRQTRSEVQAVRSAVDDHVRHDETFQNWARDEFLRRSQY